MLPLPPALNLKGIDDATFAAMRCVRNVALLLQVRDKIVDPLHIFGGPLSLSYRLAYTSSRADVHSPHSLQLSITSSSPNRNSSCTYARTFRNRQLELNTLQIRA